MQGPCSGDVLPEGCQRLLGSDLGVVLGFFFSVMKHLWRPWGGLGASWNHLGDSWRDLGEILHGALLGSLGEVLERSGEVVGRSWKSWEGLGAVSGDLLEHSDFHPICRLILVAK